MATAESVNTPGSRQHLHESVGGPSSHQHHRRGVVYFSQVPRSMRPNEVRSHFASFGEIYRQKFIPFPRRQLRNGRQSSLQFKEGWLEFLDANDARTAVERMNGSPVNSKRRRLCAGDIWNVKLLGDGTFQWGDIVTEEEGVRRDDRQREFVERQKERSLTETLRKAIEARIRKRERAEADSSVPATMSVARTREDGHHEGGERRRRRSFESVLRAPPRGGDGEEAVVGAESVISAKGRSSRRKDVPTTAVVSAASKSGLSSLGAPSEHKGVATASIATSSSNRVPRRATPPSCSGHAAAPEPRLGTSRRPRGSLSADAGLPLRRRKDPQIDLLAVPKEDIPPLPATPPVARTERFARLAVRASAF